MIKARRFSNSWRERLEVPKIPKRPQDARRGVRNTLTIAVGALLLDVSSINPRRDQPSRHPASQTIEVEGVVLASWGLGRVGEIIWTDREWRWHVVVEAAGLVKGDDEHAAVPLWAGTEGFVDFLDQLLPV